LINTYMYLTTLKYFEIYIKVTMIQRVNKNKNN